MRLIKGTLIAEKLLEELDETIVWSNILWRLKKIESKCTAFDPDKRYTDIHRELSSL